MPMDWDKLRVFHLVAEQRNIAHASEVLNVSPSAVSRQISSLEQSLGCRLFHRHARGLSLTEQGETLYETVHEMVANLALAEGRLGETREAPSGLLRIAAGISIGGDWVAPRLAKFADRYPEIRVKLMLEEEVSLSAGEADVAFVYERPVQANLVQRRMMTFELAPFASPAYLAAHGFPESAADLDSHRLIAYEGAGRFPMGSWLLEAGRSKRRARLPVLATNNTFAMRRATSLGLGIAAIPSFMAVGRADLVRVLPKEEAPSLDFWAVYPEALRGSQRLQALLDYLAREARASESEGQAQ